MLELNCSNYYENRVLGIVRVSTVMDKQSKDTVPALHCPLHKEYASVEFKKTGILLLDLAVAGHLFGTVGLINIQNSKVSHQM